MIPDDSHLAIDLLKLLDEVLIKPDYLPDLIVLLQQT